MSSFWGDTRAWTLLSLDIADLVYDHGNTWEHTPRKIGMVRESLKRFRANRDTVSARQSDGIYRVYAGNGVLEAARARGRSMCRSKSKRESR